MTVQEKQTESEKQKDSSDKQKETSERLLQETQDAKITTDKNQQKPESAPELQLVDGTENEKPQGVTETWNGDGTRRVEMLNGDRKQSVEFDAQGNATKYTAPDGEVFTKGENGWTSTNPVSQNADINVDRQTYAVTIDDRGTGNRIVRTADGNETVQYKDAGSTATTFDGNKETITINDKGRSGSRTMVIENDEKGGKLVRYTDRDGNVFNYVGMTDRKDKAEYQQSPVFRDDRTGRLVTIEADRTGNVVTREWSYNPEEHKKQQESATFAVRELNNGTVVKSNGDGSKRTVTSVDGLSMDYDRPTKTITYPTGERMQVIYEKDGSVSQVTGTVNGQEFNLRKNPDTYTATEPPQKVDGGWTKTSGGQETTLFGSVDEDNGQIAIPNGDGQTTLIDQSGKVSVVQGQVPEAKDPTDVPMTQKVPPNVDLEANIRQMKEQNVSWSDSALEFALNPIYGAYKYYSDGSNFNENVKYGGPWDFKTPGGRYLEHREYEMYGNWHYGVVGNACGFSEKVMLEEAGAAQQSEKTSKSKYGNPGFGVPSIRFGGTGTYGDDPRDAEQVRRGYQWYERRAG
jgi:hypothetical protein